MAIKVNLRHMEEDELHLEGQLPVAELDIDARDEMVLATQPLEYDLEGSGWRAVCWFKDGYTCRCGISLRSETASGIIAMAIF